MKKSRIKWIGALMAVSLLAGCGSSQAKEESKQSNSLQEITVVSREDGSGTRGAFIELFGVEEKDDQGNKVDHTTEEANICNSTAVAMTTVAEDKNAIGYISLGSLNDTVKAVTIDGAQATAENIKEGTYKISRPFNIVTKDQVSEVAEDFIQYILSSEGQKVVGDAGYIPLDETEDFKSLNPKGKAVVAGSSSVTPVMEKLKEAYLAINPNAEVEIQESDSTTGINSTIEGISDIGMASRDLKESEIEQGINSICIALDGIAVIVNKENEIEELSSETVKKIYIGEVTNWKDVK